jgi:hypothetical protein
MDSHSREKCGVALGLVASTGTKRDAGEKYFNTKTFLLGSFSDRYYNLWGL